MVLPSWAAGDARLLLPPPPLASPPAPGPPDPACPLLLLLPLLVPLLVPLPAGGELRGAWCWCPCVWCAMAELAERHSCCRCASGP